MPNETSFLKLGKPQKTGNILDGLQIFNRNAELIDKCLEKISQDKIEKDVGEEYAGTLLYVGDDGSVTTLQLGDGLSIEDGVLKSEYKASGEIDDTTCITSIRVQKIVGEDQEVSVTGIRDMVEQNVKAYLEENPIVGGAPLEVDQETLRIENGVISVNTANEAIKEDQRPITSHGVYNEFEVVNSILKTI